LVLAAPGTASSFTLDQLLAMPLGQLLQLEITSMHASRLSARGPHAMRAVEHRDAA
jgi:hypothetical protein